MSVDRKVKPKEVLPYGSNVILPSVLEIHSRIKKGFFGRETWNRTVDLYLRCPKEISEEIDFKILMEAETGKEMIIFLFVQIRFYLEKYGYLIRKSDYEVGSL